MRKQLLLLLVCVFTCVPLGAQGFWRMPWKKVPGKNLSGWQISRVLEKRAATTFEQARKAQAALPHSRAFTIGEPVRRVLHSKNSVNLAAYPDKPFLKTRDQVANYFISQSNRLFLQEVKRMQQVWKQVDTYLPQLQQSARTTPQPQQPAQWLAQQIPADRSLLFVGEIHGYTEIRQEVAALLKELREKYSAKQIVLFTEFLPENFHWTPQTPTHDLSLPRYAAVWQAAFRANIEVVGLEPDFILKDPCIMLALSREERTISFSQWASLEGVRLRNEHWSNVLKDYRKRYPEALFIVYTGAGHSLYNYPFTLSNALAGEQPFVVAFYPDRFSKLEGGDGFFDSAQEVPAPFRGPLEHLTDNVAFDQPVLQFKDNTLSRVAGFDVRVRMKIDLEQYESEKYAE